MGGCLISLKWRFMTLVGLKLDAFGVSGLVVVELVSVALLSRDAVCWSGVDCPWVTLAVVTVTLSAVGCVKLLGNTLSNRP